MRMARKLSKVLCTVTLYITILLYYYIRASEFQNIFFQKKKHSSVQ
jgi:hypothetical protein